MVRVSLPPPAVSLILAALVCVAAVVTAIALSTSTPWLGMRLSPGDRTDGIDIVRIYPGSPAAALKGSTLISIGGAALRPTDAIDEPDYLPDYRAARVFFTRQTQLLAALSMPKVTVTVADTAGHRTTATLATVERPLASLPVDFWVQLGFGVGSLLIGAWVWSLRPNETGAVMFGLSGVGMLISTTAAAIYTSRELALDGGLFRLLSAINHAGPMLFCFVMLALFLVYPTRIVSNKALLAYSILPIAWFGADALHILPNVAWGAAIPMLLHMAVIVGAIGLQWRATRSDPVGRAALRWFGLSVVGCCAIATVAFIIPGLLNHSSAVPQSWAFGFFFLIYVALAVSLRRSRAFQLDEWAFRIAFYAGAGLLLVVADAALILLLRADDALSLGVSLLAIAFLYLPTRDWLWRRLVARRPISDEALFGHIVDTALAVTAAERDARWRDLLTRLFDPLQIEPAEARAEAAILDDGMALALPATAASPPLVLRAPWAGRGLFGPSHLRLARRAMDMVGRTEISRDAYERGAAEERLRVAQDLHDDVGSLLLSGLHKTDLGGAHQVIRDAIFDVRMLASELGGGRREVADLLADLRHEAQERLSAAGIALLWPVNDSDGPLLMDFATYKAVRSSVRELISNVIRHAGARQVVVAVSETTAGVSIEISDDGRGLNGAARNGGMGLAGVARRMAAVGGDLALPPQSPGLKAVLRFPLQAGVEEPA